MLAVVAPGKWRAKVKLAFFFGAVTANELRELGERFGSALLRVGVVVATAPGESDATRRLALTFVLDCCTFGRSFVMSWHHVRASSRSATIASVMRSGGANPHSTAHTMNLRRSLRCSGGSADAVD